MCCFGDIVCQEYKGVGIWMVFFFMVDLVIEFCWGCSFGIFGEDVELSVKFIKVYILGFQGDSFNV